MFNLQLNLIYWYRHTNDNIYLQEIDVILSSVTGQTHGMNGFVVCFIMAMPFNMILFLYVISSKLSCDLAN